jgi:hypothetical protein
MYYSHTGILSHSDSLSVYYDLKALGNKLACAKNCTWQSIRGTTKPAYRYYHMNIDSDQLLSTPLPKKPAPAPILSST